MKNRCDNIKLFETHFHPDKTESPAEYVKKAEYAGVGYLVAVGSNLVTSKSASEFAEQCSNVFFSAGIHPHDASDFNGDSEPFINLLKKEKCIATGEIGLDYYYGYSGKDEQQSVFKYFLSLALELNLPAIVHCRDKENADDAYRDSFSILKEFSENGGRFVVHCFTGTVAWAEKFLDLGAYIGITGIVTFPKAQNVRDVVNIVPIDRLLVETDTPYLAPVPERGKQNHSANLPYIAEKIAEIKNKTVSEIAADTTGNAKSFFGLKNN